MASLVARAPSRSGPARSWAIGRIEEAGETISSDFQLFVTAFLGGIVFFGTLFG